MIKNKKLKKHILIATISILALCILVVGAMWIIVSDIDKELSKLSELSGMTISYTGTGGDTSVYYGEPLTTENGVCKRTGYDVYYKSKDNVIPGTWYVSENNTSWITVEDALAFESAKTTTIAFEKEYQYAKFMVKPEGILTFLGKNEYLVSDVTITASLHTVAYIGDTYYATIDGALKAANDATNTVTVYAIASGDYDNIENNRAKIAKTIAKTSTIDSNVILRMPFGDKDNGNLEDCYAHSFALSRTITVGEKSEQVATVPSGLYRQWDVAGLQKLHDNANNSIETVKEAANEVKIPNSNNAYLDKSTYCTNLVTLSCDLTVYGDIYIRGIYATSQAGSITGQTCGEFACLSIDNKIDIDETKKQFPVNKLIVEDGSYIECFGFIDLINKNDYYDHVQFLSGSTLKTPFVFYEWKGGSHSLAMRGGYSEDDDFITSPILRYVFPNIVGKYKIMYGATVYSQASVFFNSGMNNVIQDVLVIGTDKTSFIQLSKNTDNPVSVFLNIHYDSTDRDDGYFGKMHLDFYGGAKLNFLSLTIAGSELLEGTNYEGLSFMLGSLQIELSSNGKFLPVAYFYDINFHDGYYDLSEQKIKLYPGSSVTVASDAELSAKAILVYDTVPTLGHDCFQRTYPVSTKASLTVNGILDAGSLGGVVTSNTANASVTITTPQASDWDVEQNRNLNAGTTTYPIYDPKDATQTKCETTCDLLTKFGGYAGYIKKSANLSLSSLDSAVTYDDGGTYYSAYVRTENEGTDEEKDIYAWYPASITVTLNKNASNAVLEGNQSRTFNMTADGILVNKDTIGAIIPNITRPHYDFSHWCTKSSCIDANCPCLNGTYKLYEDDELFAIWTPTQYTLKYMYALPDVTLEDGTIQEGEIIDSGMDDTTFHIESNPTLSLDTDPVAPTNYPDYKFTGWFKDAEGTQSITNFTVADYLEQAAEDENHTVSIYALWSAGTVYTVNLNVTGAPNGWKYEVLSKLNVNVRGTEDEVITLDLPTKALDNTTFDSIQTATDHSHYFDGWYLDANFTTRYNGDWSDLEALAPDGEETYQRTLYARWSPKYVLNIAGSSGDTANSKVQNVTQLDPIYIFDQTQLNEELARLAPNYTQLGTDNTNKPNVQKYFAGWSVTNSDKLLSQITEVTLDNFIGDTVKSCTLEAKFESKVNVVFTDVSNSWYMTGEVVTIPTAVSGKTGFVNVNAGSDATRHLGRLNGWTYANTETPLQGSTYTVTDTNVTFKHDITYGSIYRKVTIDEGSGSSLSISGGSWKNSSGGDVNPPNGNGTYYLLNNEVDISITATASSGYKNPKALINGSGTTNTASAKANTINSITTSAESDGCVATGSLITLADGTQKKIEDITHSDMLLVWDFFKGEYAAVPASVIVFHGDAYYDVVTLIFSDGTEVRTIGAHDFFDVAANEFVSIKKDNVASFIGHNFIKTDGNGYSTVTLVDYTITNEYTGSYSILSAYHNNFIVENMLSLTPLMAIGVDRFCEYFDVGEGMKYDEEKMQADIEKYGLYTYEDFADYLTYEQYLALNAPYYKVLVEQGYVTFDDLLKAISLYVK